MWTVPNTGIAGGDVWGPSASNAQNTNFTDTTWGDSIEESAAELKTKLQRANAENAELQRQLIQYEVQLLTAQVGDAYIDDSAIPEIVSELGRQNQELKKAAEADAKLIKSLKDEVTSQKRQLDKKASQEPFTVNASQVDDLQKYIRGQAKEFVEGKAEWSMQIAEMKYDLEQKFEKLRREKDEAQRRHDLEIQQMQSQFRVNDVENGGKVRTSEKDRVTMVPEDYERLREKWAVAENRVSELEMYIRGNPSVSPNDIRDTLIQTSFDMKKSESELAALQKRRQQSIEFWDQSCRRLIATIQKHLEGKEFNRGADKMLHSVGNSPNYEAMPLSSALVTPNGDTLGNDDAYSILHSVVVDLQRFLLAAEKTESSRSNSPQKALQRIGGTAINGTVCSAVLARHAAIQKSLDELKSSRKEIACAAMAIEKRSRDMVKDLKSQVSELLGVEPIKNHDITTEAMIGLALSEVAKVLPLDENHQRKALCALRRAEFLNESLLRSFVELPEMLKKLFDLTKRVASQDEVNNLLRDVQEIQRSARAAENRHNFHVTLLQRRFEAMSKRWSSLRRTEGFHSDLTREKQVKPKLLLIDRRVNSEPMMGAVQKEVVSDDSASVSRGSEESPENSQREEPLLSVVRAEIRSIMKRDDCEDQFVNMGMFVRRHEEQIKEQMKRLDQLEEHIVDLHVSRYQEQNKMPVVEDIEATTVPTRHVLTAAP
eukprot:GEMP01008696.1.p1 GENE.GEMP01008696.1~~GEMP01008696.1.p1  ORF type:complete len:714 (+),score=132.82 GEMP01008696.1:106-2247(+)